MFGEVKSTRFNWERHVFAIEFNDVDIDHTSLECPEPLGGPPATV